MVETSLSFTEDDLSAFTVWCVLQMYAANLDDLPAFVKEIVDGIAEEKREAFITELRAIANNKINDMITLANKVAEQRKSDDVTGGVGEDGEVSP